MEKEKETQSWEVTARGTRLGNGCVVVKLILGPRPLFQEALCPVLKVPPSTVFGDNPL